MVIGLDATQSVDPLPSGVGVYCARLIEALAAAAPESDFVLCYRANRFFRALAAPRPAANTKRRLLEEPLVRWLPGRVPLFHGLNQRLPRCRFPCAATTFHDLFVISGNYSTREFRERFTRLARDAAARSDHIVAVSRHTASQLETLLGVESSRISVIHHGVDAVPAIDREDLAEFRRRRRIVRPYLLHVGALQARKNISRLVEAFEELDPSLALVLAGSNGYGASEIHTRIAASAARSRIHLLGYVSAPTLSRLYRTATVLAFPSLDEGFGLPVLEAMSAGLPVVTSRRSALAEVAGEAAVLIEPTDTAALADALRRTVEDSALRRDLIQKGHARAAQFGWQQAASQTLALYRRLQ